MKVTEPTSLGASTKRFFAGNDQHKTPGQLAYEADVRRKPFYHDGTARRSWDRIAGIARKAWERNARLRVKED